jgi:hypothetical protein
MYVQTVFVYFLNTPSFPLYCIYIVCLSLCVYVNVAKEHSYTIFIPRFSHIHVYRMCNVLYIFIYIDVIPNNNTYYIQCGMMYNSTVINLYIITCSYYYNYVTGYKMPLFFFDDTDPSFNTILYNKINHY